MSKFLLAENLLSGFFSLIGFRDPVTRDDGAVLPYVERALGKISYSSLKVGERLPVRRNWEHAVRFLGDSHVIKYVSPEPVGLMRAWISELQRQKELLQQYFPNNLVPFDYFFVSISEFGGVLRRVQPSRGLNPPGSAFATYVVVMEKVCGRSLLELSDEELFSNQSLVRSLLEFFENSNRLRRNHGIFVDVIGGSAATILNPRYTANLLVTKDNRVVVVDTVLIPPRYERGKIPAKYHFGWLYHFCYALFVRPFERHFVSRLEKASQI